jgi:hypothetical protein
MQLARFGFSVISNFALGKIWFWKVQSIFCHFVRKDTSHLSETVFGLFGRYNYSILDNKKIFFTKYFLLIK